ncbi:MAG: hypothetical protein NVV83_10565 [Afipia sp.]|jgi:hypothetical protein|nr:hypothetical protein [Afipia sp.]
MTDPAVRLSEAQKQLDADLTDVMKRLSIISNNAREISESHPIRYAANRAWTELYESPLRAKKATDAGRAALTQGRGTKP